jgi:hypothetical protein
VTADPDRVARVQALIAAQDVDATVPPGFVNRLQRLCRAGVHGIPASGVGVCVLTEAGTHMSAAVSDQASAAVEELQFSLGEGPCLDAHASRRPVLQPDLGESALRRWPAYSRAAYDHGVRAVFAFPLQIGAARVGVLDVYRDSAGLLSDEALAQALTFARIALTTVLDGQAHAPSGELDVELGHVIDDHRAEVYQAQGMLQVQLGVPLEAAMARMRAYAFVNGRTLADVAADIVARRLILERDSP